MNLGELSVRKNRVVFVLMFLVFLGGLVAYKKLGRLEDPEFTIKEALIITPYPGASAEEVAREVTNPIETACQQLGQLKRVESESTRGRSVVSAVIQDRLQKAHDPSGLGRAPPQDRRRPIAGCRPRCAASRSWWTISATSTASSWRSPATASRSPNFAAMRSSCAANCCWCATSRRWICSANSRKLFSWKSRGNGWRSWASTRNRSMASYRRRTSLPTADGCASETSTSRIDPTGGFDSADDMLELVIGSDSTGRQLFLRDVATIERSYEDPPRRLLRFDGQPAIGLGISTVQGGNVVTMGNGVRRKLEALKRDQPVGIEIGDINFQPTAVSQSHEQLHLQSGQGGHDRLRRAAVRDGPQGRADYRRRPVPDDHGDVPGDVPGRATC